MKNKEVTIAMAERLVAFNVGAVVGSLTLGVVRAGLLGEFISS
jgi:hypothetical protein